MYHLLLHAELEVGVNHLMRVVGSQGLELVSAGLRCAGSCLRLFSTEITVVCQHVQPNSLAWLMAFSLTILP